MNINNFFNLYLVGLNLSNEDFSGHDFSNGVLQDLDMTGCDLRGCDFSGADLRWTKLDGSNMTGVTYDDQTVWPEGFDSSNLITKNDINNICLNLNVSGSEYLVKLELTCLGDIDQSLKDTIASDISGSFETWLTSKLNQ